MHKRLFNIGIGLVLGLALASAGIVWAGNRGPAAGPADPASQMFTLQQLYDRLATGAESPKMESFTEPGGAPTTGSMPTLDEMMDLAPAVDADHGARVTDVASGKTFWGLTEGEWGPQIGVAGPIGLGIGVPKTGQTISHGDRDDGQLRKGVDWPDPRFVVSGQGTVTDTLTGLVWLEWADCFGARTWDEALVAANGLADGVCGLTDGSVAGDWRLPNVREQQSLIDYGRVHTALPMDHPFTLAQGYPSVSYWTSTTQADVHPRRAWTVSLYNGTVMGDWKTVISEDNAEPGEHHVWPVKGGP
jgi:hypothetical protein